MVARFGFEGSDESGKLFEKFFKDFMIIASIGIARYFAMSFHYHKGCRGT